MRLQQRSLSAISAVSAVAAVVCILLVAAPALGAEGKTVNVNTATAAELDEAGLVGAVRIVEQREKNGAFKSLDDLMLVRGIGESIYEQLKPYVAISGPTTLTEKVKLPRAPKAEKTAAKG